MNDEQSSRSHAARWRPIAAATLAFGAAAVTVFACLSGPSSAAPVSDSTPTQVSGVDQRVPAQLQGSIGGDVGQLWYQQN
jgi:hypothetical protein